MRRALGAPLDFSLYYVLPHYHRLGIGMNVEMSGGTRDGETIYRENARIGEPLGKTLWPAVSLAGADGIRFACDYDNSTDRTIGFGNGSQEMCMMLAFTDSNFVWGGGVLRGAPRSLGAVDDVAVFGGECDVIAAYR
jgi:hypothetical protein